MPMNTDEMNEAELAAWFENTDESDFDTVVNYPESHVGPSAMTITARVVRDGKWWVVEIPVRGRTYGTQGRTLAEAQFMAEDLVRMWAEELDDDALARASITLEVVGDLNSTMDAERQQHLDAEGE